MDTKFFTEAMSAMGLPFTVIDEEGATTINPKPQSPFLPGTSIQFAWDSTSLGYIKTCPRLYQLTMIEGWSPKDESVHLRFGSEYHQAIQEYDIAKASGLDHEDAIRSAVRNLLERTSNWIVDINTKAGNYKNRESLLQLVVDYFDFYADDPAETLILENDKPAVELSFKFELDWGPKAGEVAKPGPFYEVDSRQPYLLCGHLDRVVRWNDELFVLDHKTTTTTPSDYYFNQFEPNNQMTLYTLAAKVVLDAPVKGVIVEAAQIMKDQPSRFPRRMTYRTEDQLDEWTYHLEYWLNAAEAYAEAGHWPMNDTACDKFGGCRFRGICSKNPSVRETFLKADFVKLEPHEIWNPLRSREK